MSKQGYLQRSRYRSFRCKDERSDGGSAARIRFEPSEKAAADPHHQPRLRRSSSSHGSFRWWVPVVLAITLCCGATAAAAYRVGDAVDTDLVVDGVPSDALRSQMPLFGVDSKTEIAVPIDDDRRRRHFSLQFEDGLWTLPAAALQRKGEWLESVRVQFVYSKSGVGAIHAVRSTATTYGGDPEKFAVEYEWIPEEAVHLTAGYAAMFFAVLVSSLYFILASCDMLGGPPIETDGSGSRSQQQQFGASVPKWD